MNIRTSNKYLNRIVKTIVDSSDPEKVILFGSRVRGDHHAHSDYDFLVVKRGMKNERDISGRIYRALFDKKITAAVEVIVVGPENLEKRKKNPHLIYSWALKEGRLLYG